MHKVRSAPTRPPQRDGFLTFVERASQYCLGEMFHVRDPKATQLSYPLICTSDTMLMVLGCIFNSECKLTVKILADRVELEDAVRVLHPKAKERVERISQTLLDELCNQLLGTLRIKAAARGVTFDLAFIGRANHFREPFYEHESEACAFRIRAFTALNCRVLFHFGYFELDPFDRTALNSLADESLAESPEMEFWEP